MVGIAWFSIFHPKTVLILAGMVSVVALLLATRLELSTNVEDLLPKNVRSAEIVRGLVQRYGGAEPAIIAISGKGEADLEERIDLALALRDRLAADPRVRPVTGLFGEDPWALLDGPLAEGLLLYLSPAQIEQVAARLTPAAIDARVAENRESLLSPVAALGARLFQEDPLGFAALAQAQIGALRGRLKFIARDGVLTSGDGTYVVLLVRPSGPSSDVAVARGVIFAIEEAGRAALESEDLAGTVGIGPGPAEAAGIRIGITGTPAILLDYRDMLARDVTRISLVSYLAQLVLFLIAFRRLGALLVAGTSVMVGALWGLGFAALTIGQINIFTAGSLGILFGLTIDFSVHIYNRYLEEVHEGRDMLRAFTAAHGETGTGILASVGVMVWAALAAGTSRFKGLRDLGVICSAGLILSLLVCLMLIPALTALTARSRRARDNAPAGLANFGLAPLLDFVVRRPKSTIAATLLLTALCAVPALRTRLDDDVTKMRPRHAPAIVLQDDLVARGGTSLQPVLALVSGADDDEILQGSAAITAALDRETTGEEGVLATVLGPSRLVPPPDRQRASLATLRGLRASGAIDPAQVEATLLAAMDRHGFRIDAAAQRAAARVRHMLERDAPLTWAEARRGPLGPVLDDFMVGSDGGRHLGVVTAYPRPDLSSNVVVPALQRAVAGAGVPVELAGARVLSQEIRPLILRDGVFSTVFSAVGIVGILALAFRRVRPALFTAVPLVVGLCASLGVMVLIDVPFNLVTVSMLPLVIGIAIDNGIHVVHRYLESGESDVAEVLRHTGRGVVMASLTTVVGFGALLFADYPGLVSSGVLAMLGTGLAMIASVTLLPALLVLLPGHRKRKVSAGA